MLCGHFIILLFAFFISDLLADLVDAGCGNEAYENDTAGQPALRSYIYQII